jgi:hypothetical protein
MLLRFVIIPFVVQHGLDFFVPRDAFFGRTINVNRPVYRANEFLKAFAAHVSLMTDYDGLQLDPSTAARDPSPESGNGNALARAAGYESARRAQRKELLLIPFHVLLPVPKNAQSEL